MNTPTFVPILFLKFCVRIYIGNPELTFEVFPNISMLLVGLNLITLQNLLNILLVLKFDFIDTFVLQDPLLLLFLYQFVNVSFRHCLGWLVNTCSERITEISRQLINIGFMNNRELPIPFNMNIFSYLILFLLG